ncbi:MAG: MFS transporter [Sphingobium sp.]
MESAELGFPGKFALVAAALLAVLGIYSFGLVLPQMAIAFADNPDSALLSQLVATLVGFAFAIGAPISGGLVSRWGYRTVYLWSTAMFVVAGSSVLLLDNIYLILATRVVLGLSIAGAMVASLAGIGTLPETQRTKLFGLQAFAGALLGVASFIVIGALARHGWRAPFALHLIGLVLIPLILTLPRHRGGASKAAVTRRPAQRGLSPAFLLLIAFMGMASILPGTFGPFFMVHLGISDPALMSLPLVGCAGAAMVSGYFYARCVRRTGVPGMFTTALLITGIGLVATAWMRDIAGLTVTMGIVGFGVTFFTPNMNAAAVAGSPDDGAGAIGLANGVLYGSQALFPFVVEGIRGQAGPGAVFTSFGIVAIAIGMLYAVRTIPLPKQAMP